MLSFKQFLIELGIDTLGNYVNKSAHDATMYSNMIGYGPHNDEQETRWNRKLSNRLKGVSQAVDKLGKAHRKVGYTRGYMAGKFDAKAKRKIT